MPHKREHTLLLIDTLNIKTLNIKKREEGEKNLKREKKNEHNS